MKAVITISFAVLQHFKHCVKGGSVEGHISCVEAIKTHHIPPVNDYLPTRWLLPVMFDDREEPTMVSAICSSGYYFKN
jgi:hypothetical protein